jgi:hypothetical protein
MPVVDERAVKIRISRGCTTLATDGGSKRLRPRQREIQFPLTGQSKQNDRAEGVTCPNRINDFNVFIRFDTVTGSARCQ